MTQRRHSDGRNTDDDEASALRELAGLADQEAFAAALGAIRGAFAELQADEHDAVTLANACVIAASQKVRETHKSSAWLAWCEQQRDMLDLIIRDADALGAQLAREARKRHIN